MKRIFLFIALLCAITLSSGMAPSVTKAANGVKKERAVMRFDQPVQLMNVTLKGEYLFVHNDAAMARGEVCTFVYKGTVEVADALVASFHCTPAERNRTATFTVRTVLNAAGQDELFEFQFAGSSEGHVVPMNQHEHVPVAARN
jgi:hypothetical protein